MLKKKAKIRKRLARIVLAALLCSGGLHGLAAPSVAEAATTITVSNITGDEATRKLTVTADPAGSVASLYSDNMECFVVYPVPQPDGIDEVKITGSAFPAGFYGAHPDVDYTDVHKVTVSGANTVLGHVYTNVQHMEGAAANNNTLIVVDATIQGDSPFFGAEAVAGYSEKGDVTGNRIEIRNAKIGGEESYYGNVLAGASASGNAADNSVTVEGDATRLYGLLTGGLANGGNATGNEVNISSGTVGAEDLENGQVIGGYASKTASGNTVTIKGGTVLNGAYGGYSYNGAATGNALVIEGGSVYGDPNWVVLPGDEFESGIPVLAGGYSENGVASENTVTVNGGELTGEEPAVCAGNSVNGDAIKNKAIINGGTKVMFVYGGSSTYANAEGNEAHINTGAEVEGVVGGSADNGSANNNVVVINGGTVNAMAYGGQAAVGNATGNEVNISNGEVGCGPTDDDATTGEDMSKLFPVMGGVAYGGNATGNKVNISGGTAGAEGAKNRQVVGGYASKTVSGNTVTISGGTVLNGAYGGYSESGEVTGNALVIEGGTVYGDVNWIDDVNYDSVNLAGGFSEKGMASENTVTINGGKFTGKSPIVEGGFSYDNDAVKNQVIVNGGTGLKEAHGGGTVNGNAEDNAVYVNTGAYLADVYGGYTDNGSATGNMVTVSGGTLDRGNGITQTSGGYALSMSDHGAAGAVTVKNNTVTVSSGTFGPEADVTFISGGDAESYSDNGAAGAVTAINNTVTVSGGTFGGDNGYTELLGGYAESYSDNGTAGAATANNNTVTVSGGTFGTENSVTEISGGYAESNAANGTAGAATANNNTVTVSGNPVFKGKVAIIGGEADCETNEAYSETTEEACNNTVTILTPVTVYGLWGGSVWHDGTSTGNTLNIAAKNVTATKAGFFQNMNFYLPADIVNGDTMLTIKGLKDEETGEISGNDLTGVTFGVAAQMGADLAVGDTVNLVVGEQGLVTDDTLKTVSGAALGKAEFLAMNNMSTDDQYGLSISKLDANTIIATVDSKTPMNNEDRHKSPAETRESVVSMVNAGADLLAGQGMSNAADAAASEQAGKDGASAPGSGGYAPFAAVGVSSLRAQSGSHVDTKGIGLALGFARELQNKSGKLLVGPLLEYGYGRYDSYQDNGTQADGKSHYWGAGVIVKQTNHNGMYYEGSLRAGRMGSDYNRNDPVVGRMSYDSDVTYFGAHLGIGKVQDIGHDNTLDYYGKYFYSHTGGDRVFINGAGVTADFDGVDSHRLRVGTRLTHAVNEKNKIYGGLAWQYEFNGDARVTYSGGGNAPSPSVKGSSGMLELGWQVKPGRSPMVIDLGVTGWVGKQRGITANLQANWTF